MLAPDDDERAIALLTDRPTDRFGSTPPETVRAAVHAAYDQFKDKPDRDFVPVLVERDAVQRLTARRPIPKRLEGCRT